MFNFTIIFFLQEANGIDLDDHTRALYIYLYILCECIIVHLENPQKKKKKFKQRNWRKTEPWNW